MNKQSFNSVLEDYFETFPSERYEVGREANLVNLLVKMEAEGMLALPSRKGPSWRALSYHSEPEWIRLIRVKVDKISNDIAWHPKMRWGAEITSKSEFDNAVLVNEYFKKSKGSDSLMSINERSLGIFGDEKKLSRMSKYGHIFNGRLSLEDLGCYDDINPISFELFEDSHTERVLIVENLASFHSFCRWNRETQQYNCIIFGSGGAFYKSHLSIENIGLDAKEYEYLGDLDPSGLSIPASANRERLDRGLAPIVPNAWLYKQMIKQGHWKRSGDRPKSLYDRDIQWLPEFLQESVRESIDSGLRIAQEALNLDWLLNFDEIA